MNLRSMQYIVTTADLLSFSKAAKQCNVSQPTLSEQIKKIEDLLDIIIFERSNKKVIITDEGREIVESARKILREMDNIKQISDNKKDPCGGTLSIGAFPTLAPYIFPTLVPRIKKHLPKIRLILVEEKTEQLLEKLREGQIDAALLALPIEDNSLNVRPLFIDKFFVALPPSHPLAEKESIGIKELSDHELLLLEEGHCLRDQALEVCSKVGLETKENFRATSLETLRQMIKAGTGITFMPEIAISKGETGIKYIPFKKPIPTRTIALVWRKTTNREKLLKTIASFFLI